MGAPCQADDNIGLVWVFFIGGGLHTLPELVTELVEVSKAKV